MNADCYSTPSCNHLRHGRVRPDRQALGSARCSASRGGCVIGPFGLAFIEDVESSCTFAEFGVVLISSRFGLELDPKRLWEMRRDVSSAAAAARAVRRAAHWNVRRGRAAGRAALVCRARARALVDRDSRSRA